MDDIKPIGEDAGRYRRPSIRSSKGLRDALFDEIDLLRRGQGDEQRANAIVKLAGKIIETAKLEYEFSRTKDHNDPTPGPKAIELGTNRE